MLEKEKNARSAEKADGNSSLQLSKNTLIFIKKQMKLAGSVITNI